MKKMLVLLFVVIVIVLFPFCSPSRKAVVPPPKVNFETNVLAVLNNYCSPCHIPARGGRKEPFDNFENAKKDIDEMIRRIELNPGDKGFMPFKNPKLSDSVIAVFKQWKTDGLMEK